MIVAAALAAAATAAGPRQAAPVSGSDLITGRTVGLAAYEGRPVVINAWASWCGGCIVEAKDLRTFARSHPDVALLGIDTEDSRTSARAFYRAHGFTWPSIFDPKGRVARKLGVKGLPTTLFLDRRHRIVFAIAGAGSLKRFNDGLTRALSGG